MARHSDDIDHIATCADCQARMSFDALDVDLEQVWAGIAVEVWARRVGRVERLAGDLLQSPGLARALLTTPSLVLSWILASAVVLGVGVVATHATQVPWVALLAPALAGAGIAYAYGPGVDPTFELSQTMPVSDRMVLLARIVAVFGVNAVLGLGASLLTVDAVGVTFGWLAPMTLVASLGLAAASLARSANVGVASALAGWCLIVLASAVPTQELATAVENGAFVPMYALGTVVCVGVTLYATRGRRSNGLTWPPM